MRKISFFTLFSRIVVIDSIEPSTTQTLGGCVAAGSPLTDDPVRRSILIEGMIFSKSEADASISRSHSFATKRLLC